MKFKYYASQIVQVQLNYFLNLTNALFMEQSALRPSKANKNNILDLCFLNNMNIFHNVKVRPTIVSDHNII